MKPEQLEIERLRREIVKLKAERDILKKPRPILRVTRYEVRVHREAPSDMAGIMDLRDSRGLAQRLSCLADPIAERAVQKR
jgi:transposase